MWCPRASTEYPASWTRYHYGPRDSKNLHDYGGNWLFEAVTYPDFSAFRQRERQGAARCWPPVKLNVQRELTKLPNRQGSIACFSSPSKFLLSTTVRRLRYWGRWGGGSTKRRLFTIEKELASSIDRVSKMFSISSNDVPFCERNECTRCGANLYMS